MKQILHNIKYLFGNATQIILVVFFFLTFVLASRADVQDVETSVSLQNGISFRVSK